MIGSYNDDWPGCGKLHHKVGNGDMKEPVVLSFERDLNYVELSFERDLNCVIKDHGFTFCIRKWNLLLVHEMSKKRENYSNHPEYFLLSFMSTSQHLANHSFLDETYLTHRMKNASVLLPPFVQ